MADIRYQVTENTVTQDVITSVDTAGMNRTKSTSLLSSPSLVESPFVILQVGNYTFGSYVKDRVNNNEYNVDFPNYMTSVDIVKVNGTVNQYNIQMVYLIREGDDPNLLDKIFSTVGYGTVYISCGDWASPSFIYKKEEALITKLASDIDFANSRITYTLSCTSNSLALVGTVSNFAKRTAKPSSVIFELLYSNQTSGLLDIFYGMKNRQKVINNNLIPTNDKVVEIPAKNSIDMLSYINFLVTCMSANTNTTDSAIKDSSYFMTIVDDLLSDFGGPHFKITQVMSKSTTFNSIDTYEVDIGYPSDNLVTSFSIRDKLSWALLYNYSENILQRNYRYTIDDSGHLKTDYSKSLTTSDVYYKTTEALKTWWTNMTQFPIQAELIIKGLVRPAILMSYVRVNAFFFGQRHISSGLYFITKQEDKIDRSGYRTILTLTRCAGDSDYISRTTRTVVSKTPIITNTAVTANNSANSGNTSTTQKKSTLQKVVSQYTYPSGNTYQATTLGSAFNFNDVTEQQIITKINRGDSTFTLVGDQYEGKTLKLQLAIAKTNLGGNKQTRASQTSGSKHH